MFTGKYASDYMCVGIALLQSEIPLELIEKDDLSRRIHERGGEREVRFLYRDYDPVLPVWYGGRLTFFRWGNRRRSCHSLPPTAWTWLESVEGGKWSPWAPELVDIPATFGLEGGVWFRIRQGIRGLLVHDELEQPVVYMMCEPATRYYRVMTRAERMPVLIDERI
jgi:hypothetical protein